MRLKSILEVHLMDV